MDFHFSKKAQKAIIKMDKTLKKRIREAIEKLPTEGDIKMLQNYKPTSFRLRVGKYRIIFRVVTEKDIYIDNIDSRGDIYK